VAVLDQYRIMALEKILAVPLTIAQRQAVLERLVEKCHIVAHGAYKRQHHARWTTYHAKKQQYQHILENLRQPGEARDLACQNAVNH
jgi:hypothetical protein